MSQTPTKLDVLRKINELISAYNSLKDTVATITEKLNGSRSIREDDFADSSDVAPLDLTATDQLINRRE